MDSGKRRFPGLVDIDFLSVNLMSGNVWIHLRSLQDSVATKEIQTLRLSSSAFSFSTGTGCMEGLVIQH